MVLYIFIYKPYVLTNLKHLPLPILCVIWHHIRLAYRAFKSKSIQHECEYIVYLGQPPGALWHTTTQQMVVLVPVTRSMKCGLTSLKCQNSASLRYIVTHTGYRLRWMNESSTHLTCRAPLLNCVNTTNDTHVISLLGLQSIKAFPPGAATVLHMLLWQTVLITENSTHKWFNSLKYTVYNLISKI